MSSNKAPILTLDASALDRLSFADLYHYRAGLDRLACSLTAEDAHTDLMESIFCVIRHAQAREAQSANDVMWKFLCVFDAGYAFNEDDLTALCSEISKLVEGSDEA